MYAKKELVTFSSLKKMLNERDLYSHSICSLRKLLISIGFEYRKDCNRRALMEQEHIRLARIKFLKEYHRNFISINLETVFLDETWIFSKGGQRRSWQDSDPASVEKGSWRRDKVHCGSRWKQERFY